MKIGLAALVAARYFRTRRRGTGNASSLLSVIGIAVGVTTLTVVLAVMNGFQLGFIESIVEISSYHLQIRRGLDGGLSTSALEPSTISSLQSIGSLTAVVPFVQRQALIEGVFQRPRACSVRAVPPELFSLDSVQARMLAPKAGAFDLADARSLVLGSELAAAMGISIGDPVSLTSYGAGTGGRPFPRRDTFHVTGIFRTGYYDFDSSLVFMSLAAADALYGGGVPLDRTWGVKIANRFDDARPLHAAAALLGGTGWVVESWRSYNRSFFDALFMEKLMMMVLLGLIFIVVGANVFHSLRRRVFERMEEIAVLKAVGIPPRRIQGIFILEGLFIGLAGGAAGLCAGLALAVNVNGVFGLIETVINTVLRAARLLLLPFISEGTGNGFAIFSPSYFYLTEVPSRVFLGEAFLVVFFALAACVAAAWGAARAVSGFRPSEVLRYE